jgi:peptidoglycan/xylan/chitin deacetylase (PgdA/CDA1 family)
MSIDGQASRGAVHARGACALTFDDGPDSAWTPRVLAELDCCKASATFFVVGERVAADPEPARAALAAGHEIELHCYRHIRHTELSEVELEVDTTTALAEFERAGLGRPRYWRTPWGVRTAATERVAARHGLRLVGWTIDTHDWRGDGSVEMLEQAMALLCDGAIVLMHDALGPGAMRAGVEGTIGLIAPLVALASGRGLRPLSLALRTHPPSDAVKSGLVESTGPVAIDVEQPALGVYG